MRNAKGGGIEEALPVVFRLPKLSGLWQAVPQDGQPPQLPRGRLEWRLVFGLPVTAALTSSLP